MTTVCENIKKFRKFRGMSQAELGQRVGRSKNVISNWERGENEPDLEAIAATCKALGVTPNQIFGWDKFDEYEEHNRRLSAYLHKLRDLEKEKARVSAEIAAIKEKIEQ